jgi:NADP-dependent 3-hydroxy acid dehydrogenase YdfG
MNTAVVTGATRGAGRAVAARLTREGWRVLALGRDPRAVEELRADFGVEPMAIDLTDRSEMRALAENFSIDALIHAALRWPAGKAFCDLREADIDMTLEVNLSVALHLTHVVLPQMLAARRGAIVFVAQDRDPAAGIAEATIGGALAAFSTALRNEMSGEGVGIEFLHVAGPSYEGAAENVARLVGSMLEPRSGDSSRRN